MGKCEELLNSGVSAMGENGEKFVGQWCFSNGKMAKVADNGVSAMGKMVKGC
jgi:hypothetical protein